MLVAIRRPDSVGVEWLPLSRGPWVRPLLCVCITNHANIAMNSIIIAIIDFRVITIVVSLLSGQCIELRQFDRVPISY